MNHNRPIDRFVEKSLHILQKEYVVIGKRRVSSFTAWTIIAFFVGITVAIAFLASRSGELQGSFAAAPTVYQASQDFKDQNIVSATNRWLYLGGAAQKLATYSSNDSRCGGPCWYTDTTGEGQFLLIGPGWQHPGAGASGTPTGESIRAWHAPGNGDARVELTAKDIGGSCGGDGVVVTVKRGDSDFFWQNVTIPDNNVGFPDGKTLNQTKTVNTGDPIYFIVSKGNNNWCDTTLLDPKITFTPTGSGAALSCTGVTGPDSSTQIVSSTNKTSGAIEFYAKGVSLNTTAMNFPVWTEANGQDDLFWYPGTNLGGGTWKGVADLSKHPDAGLAHMHAYMSEGTKWEFCGGIGFTKPAFGGGKVTVSKAYLEVSPLDTDTKIRLDSGIFTSAKSLTFNSVPVGDHTVSIEVPAGMKVFYAVCPNATSCKGPINEGVVGPVFTTKINIADGTQNKVVFVLTPGNMKFVSSVVPINIKDIKNLLKAPNAHAGLSLDDFEAKWVDVDGPYSFSFPCSRNFTVLDPTESRELDLDNAIAAKRWIPKVYPNISIEVKKDSQVGKLKFSSEKVNNRAAYSNTYHYDGENIIAYTQTFADKPWDSVTVGYTTMYGLGDIIAADGTLYSKYILESDIGLFPYIDLPQLVLTHEFGHALSLGHAYDPDFVMAMSPIETPNILEINKVNKNFSHCAPQPPKPATLSISFLPARAAWTKDLDSPYCGPNGNVIGHNIEWLTKLKISEGGGEDIKKFTKWERKIYDCFPPSNNCKPRDTDTDDHLTSWHPAGKGSTQWRDFTVSPQKDWFARYVEFTLHAEGKSGNKLSSTATLRLNPGKKFVSAHRCGGPDYQIPPVIFIGPPPPPPPS